MSDPTKTNGASNGAGHGSGADHEGPGENEGAEDEAVEGAPEAVGDLDEGDDPARLGPPPLPVAELAAACVRFVSARYKVALDFQQDSLALVDAYVRDARKELREKPETLDLLAGSIGAHLGEVMRRAFGAHWFAEGDQDGWRLDFKYVYLTFNPIGMAREALTLAVADGWHAFFETEEAERELLNARFAALGELDEDEYYAPSTRFDMVEIAVDALRSRMMADGHADVTFGPEDYEKS
jgi:hypothetical protein